MKPKIPLFEPSIMLIETVRKRLKEVVKNQEAVIDRMCTSLLSKSFRDKDDQRVLYAALLNGTSGCGKTTLAREFARIMDEELKKEL
jgi:ATP-dependent Clp protease ATP-binding subunit ClpA